MPRSKQEPLQHFYNNTDNQIYEIGIDEAGRGDEDKERGHPETAEERQAERRSARLVNPLKARMEDIFSMVNDSAGAQKLKLADYVDQ